MMGKRIFGAIGNVDGFGAEIIDAMGASLLRERGETIGKWASLHPSAEVGWISGDTTVLHDATADTPLSLLLAGDIRANASRNTFTELLDLYKDCGAPALSRLNGSYCGTLIDRPAGRVTLFNDRYGLNRIYYHESATGFYFASEAKALLRGLPATRALDNKGLGEFFSCGCVLQNRSLFRGVSILPPGSAWEFTQGRIEKLTYFTTAELENQETLNEADYHEQFAEIFPRVLHNYLEHDRVGMSLTAGVDSRLIMACAKRAPNSMPCYTFGGTYRPSIDVRRAREVAQACQQPHSVIEVADQFLSAFPQLASDTVQITDGAMDVSGAADLYVNCRAKEIAPVRLTGNYGGEVFRELVAFKPAELYPLSFAPEFRPEVKAAAQTYWMERSGSPRSFVIRKQLPWHHYSRLSLERSQLTVTSPYLDNELVRFAFRTPASLARKNSAFLSLIRRANPRLAALATDRGLRPSPIPFVTRAQHLFQEFTFRAEYAYDYGMPNALARLDSRLKWLKPEKLFLGRHKFHHFRIWYRDQLSPYLKAVLLDPRSLAREHVNRKAIEEMVRAHTSGHRNYTQEFHRLLTIELLQRQLIERN